MENNSKSCRRSCKSSPFIQCSFDEGTFSVRVRGKPFKQLIDVHENSGLNRQKKPFEGAC